MQFILRVLLLSGALGFLLSCVPSRINNTVEERPNIILILTDDLGYGDLSCQGATDLSTPHIDAIARQGRTFINFYANSPVCSPSRAALLSGRYPDMVGVPGVIRQEEEHSWGYLTEDATLLPQLLNRTGYHTGMIGKWHLGYEAPNTPNARGFDHFKGFLGDMMHDYWSHLNKGMNWMRLNNNILAPEDREGHATDLFTDWAIDYVRQRKTGGQPFFLYLAYNAPHFPIQPPAEWLERVHQRELGISEERAKNVAFIEHLDFNVGRILQALDEEGLAENTLVIFTSDNGGALEYAQSNGPLRGNKQEMYEGGIRIPMFVMWKGKIEAGSTSAALGLLMDLFPTLSDVAGAEPGALIDGISLLPAMMGKEQITDDRYIFWVRREGWHYGGQAYYAARYKDYKILQNSAYEPLQFFNLGKDEYEKAPLPTDDSEVYRQLRNELQKHIKRAGAVPWQKG